LVLVVLLTTGAALGASESGAGLPANGVAGEDAPVELAGLTLFVREFLFEGNTIVSDEELRELLAPMVGRRLTLNELHLASAAVALYYRALGYFAADAILPPQEIVDDAVTIRVFEGRYDQLVIDNRSSLRDSVVRSIFHWFKTDSLIESSPYERATLLLAEIPGIEATAYLAPGSREGTADLVILLQDGKQAAGQLALERRSFASGAARLTTSFSPTLDNPLGRGDQISMSVSVGGTSSGSHVQQGRVEYTLPVGAGGKVGFGYSGALQSIPDALEVLDISVWSHSTSLSAAYAAVLTQQSSLSVGARLERTGAGRSINGYETSEGQRTRLSAGIEGQRRWDFAGGVGMNEFAVNTTLAARSSGGAELFHKMNGTFTQRRWWAGGVEVVGSLRLQWAFTNLESGEKMELRPSGHRVGVSGDLGWTGQIEVRKAWPRLGTLPGRWEGFLRLDAGGVQRERFPAGEAVAIERRYGVGAGLTWGLPGGSLLALEFGLPLSIDEESSERAGELALRYAFSF